VAHGAGVAEARGGARGGEAGARGEVGAGNGAGRRGHVEVVLVELELLELALEVFDRVLIVVGLANGAAGVRLARLGVGNARWRDGTTGGDRHGDGQGRNRRVGGRDALLGGGNLDLKALGGLGNIKNVESSAGGLLLHGWLGGVVRDHRVVHDVVVPVALAGLEGGLLEAEVALPAARLAGGILGERELTRVVVPGAEKVNGLAVGGGSESERK